jgi:cysteine desulfurase / selenocysteine lyase
VALLPAEARALDGGRLRADFPVFERPTRSGRPLSYLDSASSSQKPRVVIEAIADAYGHHYANVHRGVYELSVDADARYEGARQAVAAFIGASSHREVVFVRNATEALNLVAFSFGRSTLQAGDVVLSTQMEHHANLVPWQQLAAATGATLLHVHLTDDGRLDLDDLARHLERRPRIVAISHVSNALGTINPVAELTRLAHDAGATVVLDAAQSAPHMALDVGALGVDFAALSGHKMLGPSGIGVLWGRRELLDAMPPFLTGGSMIKRVTLDSAEWNEVPWKFEAGTPAIAEASGLAAAIRYLDGVGMASVRAHERELFQAAWAGLGAIPGVRLLGPADADQHAGVISFVLDGVHPHDTATILDEAGIAVRAGHHCAQPVMQRYDVAATTRASFYVYNDLDDVDRLVEGVHEVRRVFGLS